jgi:hypothetical protein
MTGARRFGALASIPALAALACGQIDTAVGEEFTRDAGAESAVTIDAPAEASRVCTGDLSNLGTGDFHVSLTVTTTEGGLAGLANQRHECDPSVFWDIRLDQGFLDVEVDDVAHYTQLFTTRAVVNDGQPHDILAARVAGTLSVYVDGVLVGSGASLASLGPLDPLVSGTDVCVTSADGTVAFVGQIANLCVGP